MPEGSNATVTDEITVGTARGYTLRGFMHDPRSDTFVVLLERPFQNLDGFVTGRVRSLTDQEWSIGHYFSNPRAAARNMIQRAGVDVE
jgi:hypothetical protein